MSFVNKLSAKFQQIISNQTSKIWPDFKKFIAFSKCVKNMETSLFATNIIFCELLP